jgi:sulfur-oxidizing protein SoxA
VRKLAAAAAFVSCALSAAGMEPPIPKNALRQGSEFTSPDVRAMQADEFANPGMLWVSRGERLWTEPAGAEAKSCAACHGEARESMKGVATRYPRFDQAAGRLLNLGGRVNVCR